MPHHLDLSASFKHLVTLAIAFAVFGGLFVANANAQTTWTVQIIGTDNPSTAISKPKYGLSRQDLAGGVPCKYSNSVPDNLKICPTDTVQWVAINQNGSKMAHSEMVVYHEHAILLDDNGNPGHGFHASAGDAAGGAVAPHAAQETPHEYYVVVVDKAASHTYFDDPKIIIGTGIDDVVLKMKKDCTGISVESDANTPAQKLCKDVQTLIDLLHLQ
jgi:hypothetical protein